MLALIGEKQARLSRAAARLPPRKQRGASLREEIENERARIARELHAGAGQPLAGIRMNLEFLEEWFTEHPGEAQANPGAREGLTKTLGRIRRLTDEALGQVRAVAHRLHPPDWQNLSITAALKLLVEESGLAERCRVAMDVPPLPEEPDHAVRVALYRTAQECLSNALRHSGATRFELRLGFKGDNIRLHISDNGCGIPEDALKRGGIGLVSIREHAQSVGGICRISSSLAGTTIQIEVPFREE
jgi:signal transduction histidine kinase